MGRGRRGHRIRGGHVGQFTQLIKRTARGGSERARMAACERAGELGKGPARPRASAATPRRYPPTTRRVSCLRSLHLRDAIFLSYLARAWNTSIRPSTRPTSSPAPTCRPTTATPVSSSPCRLDGQPGSGRPNRADREGAQDHRPQDGPDGGGRPPPRSGRD